MPASFEITSSSRTYGITVGQGGIDDFMSAREGALVLCDDIFAERLRAPGRTVISVQAAEEGKTLDAAGRIVETMRERGVARSDRMVVVGGGVVQDLACFAASIYMRGISWDYCPTTLLGMVDSCVGGKSSLNVGQFKNIAGTYHPPEHILIDVDFARTLGHDQFAGGLCEAAKICFARGPDAFASYLATGAGRDMQAEELAEVVALSLLSKKWFIEVDEFDRAERLTLNFGHTFGHALEAATGFAVNHGLAVGIGVMCALSFATRETGFDGPQTRALYRHMRDLVGSALDPPALSGLDPDRFERAFLSDKKHTHEALRLILPVRRGKLPLAVVGLPRSQDTLVAAMQSLADVMREFLPGRRAAPLPEAEPTRKRA